MIRRITYFELLLAALQCVACENARAQVEKSVTDLTALVDEAT